MAKKFNVTGLCLPEHHYMVDISDKIEEIKGYIDAEEYFTINRARQYGKTTTLEILKDRLEGEYLGVLRNLYLKRNNRPTFRTVILAGVRDIKNLKVKMRSEKEHEKNSPWNIAADFDVEMSLSKAGIEGMMKAYEEDYHTGMDIAGISEQIYDYTSGYPFLVHVYAN